MLVCIHVIVKIISIVQNGYEEEALTDGACGICMHMQIPVR